MRKLERKVVVTIGFFASTAKNVEMVMDTEPTHEKLELLAEMNQADYVDIGTRLVTVEG
jgi:hypothetical protein